MRLGISSLALSDRRHVGGEAEPLTLSSVWTSNTPTGTIGSHAGEIEVIVDVVLPDWTPSTSQYVIRKYGGSNSNRVWGPLLVSSGRPGFNIANNGASTVFNTSPSALPLTNGERGMVRWRHSIVGNFIEYAYKLPDEASWTVLSTAAAVISVATNSTATAIEVGVGCPAGSLIHSATFANAIDGDPDIIFDAANVQPNGTVVCPVSGLVFTQA